MGSDDAVLSWLQENEAPNEVIEAHKGSALRQVIKEKDAEIERLRTFEDKVVKLEKAPVRENAFKEHAKVDFEKLSESDRFALGTFDWEGEAPSPEKVTEFAARFKFPTIEGAPDPEPAPAAGAIGNQAANGGGTPRPETTEAQVQKLQAEGKWQEAMALKTAGQLEAAQQA